MVELKRDILRTREIASEKFTQCIDESNKIWYGVLRLIITLSSSFLVLTIALVEKLFPPVGGVINLPKFLIISWILLFLSIIFGIIAELNEAVFQSNQARARGKMIHELNQKIAQGLKEDIIKIDAETDYMIFGTIIWGAVSINSFILAILFICLALLQNIISRNTCLITLVSATFFIIFVNAYLIQKRKK
ncbi:MAG: hypothetical protein ABSB18_06980 [Candidatus Omnitrophota bacterium]